MEKSEFIEALKDFNEEIISLRKECSKISGNQIQNSRLRRELESLATQWFDEFGVDLRSKYKIGEDILAEYDGRFSKILELVGGRPTKRVMLTILDSITENYRAKLIVVAQTSRAQLEKYPILDTLLTSARESEIEYLVEAIECARLDKKRAAIVLGWCAAVNRLHLYVEKRIGFDRFSEASRKMSEIKVGRYKRYETRYEIHNLGELRTNVSDNNLLWVLEFLEAFDGQLHDKLGIDLTMRDTCAHPGEATVSDENLSSFFSDINSMIFNSSKIGLD